MNRRDVASLSVGLRFGPAVAQRLLVAIGIVVGAAFPAARAASLSGDPDWPCMMIRVADLSLGAVWSGPPVEPYLATWSSIPDVAELVRRVSERRMPREQADREIHAFADAAGGLRRERLLELLAGVFATLGDDRRAVMTGLDRFGRRQKELAVDVRADLDALRAASAASAASAAPVGASDQVAPLQRKVEWETRLFEQRRESLHFACDVPTRIEQRLFMIARIVQPMVE